MPKISSYANVTPADADQILITDDSDTNASKNVLVSALKTFLFASPTVTGSATIPAVTGQVTFDDGSAAAPTLSNTGDANTGIFFPAADSVGVAVAGVEAHRTDESGNFLVGKTVASVVPGFQVQQTGETWIVTDGFQGLYIDRLTSDGTMIAFAQDNSVEGSISITGATTSYNTTSDYRKKENVVPMTGATERLLQLKPSTFNFISHPETSIDGFLAHEAQAIVPEAVQGVKDEVDDEGNPVYQQIDQSKLVPLLVATIQELETRIAALEA